MSALIAWLITILVVVLLACFLLYIRGLRALPTRNRPRTATYDRFGQFIELTENPDYRENPGEDKTEEPDIPGNEVRTSTDSHT